MLLSRDLKDRERDILKLMAQGLTNSQIANQLYLARETVRWYNKQIYTKLGVHNRTHAVMRAQDLGLLESMGKVDDVPVPPVQYARSDDAYLAYQVIGDGPIDLFYVEGLFSHIECAWEQPRCAWAFRRLGVHSRLILMDKRGAGLSDRSGYTGNIQQPIDDIRAVMKEIGSEKVVLLASCIGAPIASQMAAEHPDIVSGLILLNGFIKGSRSPEFPWALPFDLYDQIFDNVAGEWGGPYGVNYFVPDADADFRQWWARYLRLAVSPGEALQGVEHMRQVDVTPILPNIHVPTLVMHSRQNRVVRVESGRYTADHIPDARYVEIPDKSHMWWWDADSYLNEIETFLETVYDSM